MFSRNPNFAPRSAMMMLNESKDSKPPPNASGTGEARARTRLARGPHLGTVPAFTSNRWSSCEAPGDDLRSIDALETSEPRNGATRGLHSHSGRDRPDHCPWRMGLAGAEAANWPKSVKVAVNLSPVQFRDRGLALHVVSALAKSELPAQRLGLEVTERLLLEDSDGTLAAMEQLKNLGVSISLDDFGTGYSSLNYLRKFPSRRSRSTSRSSKAWAKSETPRRLSLRSPVLARASTRPWSLRASRQKSR
jgi:EAL domain